MPLFDSRLGQFAERRLESEHASDGHPGSHYDPNQPRVPAGEPGGGQWTYSGGGEHDLVQKANAVPLLLRLLLGGAARAPIPRALPRIPIVPRGMPEIRPSVPGIPPRMPDVPPRGSGIPPIVPGVPPIVPGIPPEPPRDSEEGSSASLQAGQQVLRDGYALLRVLSKKFNSAERQAFVVFRALNFDKMDADGRLNLDDYGIATTDEVNELCKNGLSAVQKWLTKAVTEAKKRGNYPSAQAYGTAVHAELKKIITDRTETFDHVDKTKFRAEISYGEAEPSAPKDKNRDRWKEVGYAEKGSIRIDVVQDVGANTVCVYDLKTGLERLSVPRMEDFAKKVASAGNRSETRGKEGSLVTNVLVTEVRPESGSMPSIPAASAR